MGLSLTPWDRTVKDSCWDCLSGNVHSKAKEKLGLYVQRDIKDASSRSNTVSHMISAEIVPKTVHGSGTAGCSRTTASLVTLKSWTDLQESSFSQTTNIGGLPGNLWV